MNTRKFGLLAATALLAPPVSFADTVSVNDQVMVRDSTLPRPSRGMTMTAVEAQFGAPQNRRAAVGNPPITRWDYAGFAVFFEHARVIHAVVTGAAAP